MQQSDNLKKIDLSMRGVKHNSLSRSQCRGKKTEIENTEILNKRIVSPQKLKILVLSGNQLQSNQLEFLSKCISLIKLDLSHNNITKIQSKYGIQDLNNLRVLNLQSNKLSTIQAMQPIFGMLSLQIFSYKDNLLEQSPKIEHFLVNQFPNLKVINLRIVFIEERDPFFLFHRKYQFISKQFEQWQPVEHSQKYYLKILKLQLQYVDNMWFFHNPVVKIQRIWRALVEEMKANVNWKTRTYDQFPVNRQTPLNIINAYKQQQEQQIQKIIILKYFEQWKSYSNLRFEIKKQLQKENYIQEDESCQLKNKQFLTYSLKQYITTLRNFKVKNIYQNYLEKLRHKIYITKMAQVFREAIYSKVINFQDPNTSFYGISKLNQTKKLYFNRVQQHLVENLLAHIQKNLKIDLKTSKSHFGIGNQYVAVRLMDPDTYAGKNHYSALTYLMWPSMRSVILKKKKYQFKQKSSLIKIKSLRYIKNLNKHLTAQQITKSNNTYNRIDKFIQHEYIEGMGYFYSDDELLMKQLVRLIYYHNIKAIKLPKIIQRSEMMSLLENYDQSISIYTETLLERTTSAVKIQQQWRKYINNKRQLQSIYDQLKKNRAARLIQRFIRDRVFFHRLSFMRDIEKELKHFDDNDILVPYQVYQKLDQLIDHKQQNFQLYKGFSIEIKQKLALFRYQFPQKEIFFPTVRHLHFASENFNEKFLRSQGKKVDIYKFFHFNSQTKIIQCLGEKFYQFVFKNSQQAKLRIACFALLTYRVYGRKSMFLLSKKTLSNYNQKIKGYKSYGVECSPFRIQKVSFRNSSHSFKVNLISDITQQLVRPFIFLNEKYQSLFTREQINSQKKIEVQFYQKRYQDYPEKYSDLLKMIYRIEIDLEKQFKFCKFSIDKMLGREDDIKQSNQKGLNYAYTDENNNKAIAKQKSKITMINIKAPQIKNILTKPSLFMQSDEKLQKDIVSHLKWKTSTKIQSNNLNQFQNQFSVEEIQKLDILQKNFQIQKKKNHTAVKQTQATKKQQVNKFIQSEKEKRTFFKQKKQIDLTLIRQKRRQQKVMNITLKNFNETQRVQMLRKKAEKVKEYKKRSVSTGHGNDEESQFLQQGNFIMEQHLRMNLMRQKMKQADKLKQKRKSVPRSLTNTQSLRQSSQQSKSMKSTGSIRQHRINFQGNRGTQQFQNDRKRQKLDKMGSGNRQLIDRGQSESVNKRMYMKKKSNKLGAYIRDPSLVHGVFPEEYYPIENGKGGICLPKVI